MEVTRTTQNYYVSYCSHCSDSQFSLLWPIKILLFFPFFYEIGHIFQKWFGSLNMICHIAWIRSLLVDPLCLNSVQKQVNGLWLKKSSSPIGSLIDNYNLTRLFFFQLPHIFIIWPLIWDTCLKIYVLIFKNSILFQNLCQSFFIINTWVFIFTEIYLRYNIVYI